MNGQQQPNKRQSRFTRAAVTAFALAGLGIGCTPVPTEVSPFGPQDCNDLELGSPLISLLPGAPVHSDDSIPANAGFRIYWSACYHRGALMNYFGHTGEYVARVTILEDGEDVFSAEIDATPLNVASCDYDEIFIDEGLPAGNYVIHVALDPYGDVEQCNDLIFVLNNVATRELTVDPEPIDDVVVDTAGADNDSSPRGGRTPID